MGRKGGRMGFGGVNMNTFEGMNDPKRFENGCAEVAKSNGTNPLNGDFSGTASGAARFDTGKARMDLLSPVAMEGVAIVLAFGAKKYAEHNWRKGMKWGRTIGSLLRHTYKFMAGEDIDLESGLPHVDHIACNAMFLQEYYRTHKHLDDRFKSDEKV